MISFILTLLATFWTLAALWFVREVAIPGIVQRIEERRWRRLHPGLTIVRRSWS